MARPAPKRKGRQRPGRIPLHNIGGPDLASTARVAGWEETNSTLHEARIDAVIERLLSSGATTVVDLGCGAGSLLLRLLAEPHLRRIVGIDSSSRALLLAKQLLTSEDGTIDPRLSVRQATVTDVQEDLEAFDAAVMVETIEHLDPALLGRLERSVFVRMRPRLVVLTTPNSEYNTLLGLEPGEYRHQDHRFEWDRRRFERWGRGVANRTGYRVEFEGVGPANAWYGSATQLAVFRRADDTDPDSGIRAGRSIHVTAPIADVS
jgi:3' terminal RNA ribose 2'-O-methyltransferase Hen1